MATDSLHLCLSRNRVLPLLWILGWSGGLLRSVECSRKEVVRLICLGFEKLVASALTLVNGISM